MHTCVDQYNANKASNANGGLKWIQKGGGYYSECNKRLKGAACDGRPVAPSRARRAGSCRGRREFWIAGGAGRRGAAASDEVLSGSGGAARDPAIRRRATATATSPSSNISIISAYCAIEPGFAAGRAERRPVSGWCSRTGRILGGASVYAARAALAAG